MSLAHLVLDPSPEGPRQARAFLSDVLVGGGHEHDADLAGLLLSEVVTNAFVHTGSVVEVHIAVTDSTLRVEVNDDNPNPPQILDSSPDEPGGFGLPIVEQLAQRWGHDPIPEGGKTVWFEISTHPG
jgi:two-component sensor histidine kinase